MTDPTQPPIIVPASPVPAQFMAGVRQVGLGLSVALTMLGKTKYAAIVGDPQVITAAGIIASGVFFLWGQAVTWIKAKQLTVTATHAPDSIAQIKP